MGNIHVAGMDINVIKAKIRNHNITVNFRFYILRNDEANSTFTFLLLLFQREIDKNEIKELKTKVSYSCTSTCLKYLFFNY